LRNCPLAQPRLDRQPVVRVQGQSVRQRRRLNERQNDSEEKGNE
jgi:hypothetical protein